MNLSRQTQVIVANREPTGLSRKVPELTDQPYRRENREHSRLRSQQAQRLKELNPEAPTLEQLVREMGLDTLRLRKPSGETHDPRRPSFSGNRTSEQ